MATYIIIGIAIISLLILSFKIKKKLVLCLVIVAAAFCYIFLFNKHHSYPLIHFKLDDSLSSDFKINQVGYYVNASKIAVVPDCKSDTFYVVNKANRTIIFEGILSNTVEWSFSNEKVRLADFSSVTDTGEFSLFIPEYKLSFPFLIKEHPFDTLSKCILKSYYFQRASVNILSAHAGKWARKGGHADDKVIVHASAATEYRPEGTIISSPGGWYDAGDYNKYIVSSGISIHNLLLSLIANPLLLEMKLNIPESQNNIPDILDEVIWQIRWMFTMQDNDGGVYHKLTSVDFPGNIMPHNDASQRYVVQKTTNATLDFAASMAVASRVLKSFDGVIPGIADSCLDASKKAFKWASINSLVLYDQGKLNSKFKPEIYTGTYCLLSDNFQDEFLWASIELYLATNDESYIKDINLWSQPVAPSTWDNTSVLGFLSLAFVNNGLSEDIIQAVGRKLVELGKSRYDIYLNSPYGISLNVDDFEWRSNTKIVSHGILLMTCYQMTKDEKYLKAAMSDLDYVLGKNPLGYCFVTGFGNKSPQNLHHRISFCDGIGEPIPGLLVSGAQAHIDPVDSMMKRLPVALRYRDHYESFETNENAINQSASLFLLISLIEAANN